MLAKAQDYKVEELKQISYSETELELQWTNPDVYFTELRFEYFEYGFKLDSIYMARTNQSYLITDLTPGRIFTVEVSTILNGSVMATAIKQDAFTSKVNRLF